MSDPYSSAISSIESSGNYNALGPVTKTGDRAYGKYQIMGANIGPWSKQHLGRELSADEFLADPGLQDQIFRGQFQQYVDKYGPEGAAQAWFGGPGAVGQLNRRDQLGTSVGQYGQKFMAALGQPTQPAPQPSPQAPQTPADAAPGQPMPAYGWSPNSAPAQAPAARTNQEPAVAPPQSPQMAPLGPMPDIPLGAPRRPPDLSQLQALLQRARTAQPGYRFSRS